MGRQRKSYKKTGNSKTKPVVNQNQTREDKQIPESNGTSTKTSDSSVNDTTTSNPVPGKAGDRNDVSWYANFPELLFSAGNFPWNYPLGNSFMYGPRKLFTHTVSGNTFEGYVSGSSQIAFPGVCTVLVKHTIPGRGRQTDAINVAANAFYTHLRVVNSGRKNYDPNDSMLYNLAIADIYSLIFFLQKVYGLATQYSQQNKYVGRACCIELGVDWDDLLLNLANFRYWLNAYTKKMQAYAVPSSIPYYMRRAFMYSGLYLENDKENIKDQLYQFKPYGFYKFELDPADGSGMLTIKPWCKAGATGTLWKISDIINYAEDLITNVWADEDFALISGDIIKAYGSNLITVDEIPADFTVLPIHNPDVLAQIKQAVLWRLEAETSGSETYTAFNKSGCHFGNVYQNGANLFCYEAYPAGIMTSINKTLIGGQELSSDLILSSEFSLGTPEYVVEATRLMATHQADDYITSDAGKTMHLIGGGTEIAISCAVCYYDQSQLYERTLEDFVHLENSALDLYILMRCLAFKYLPMQYVGKKVVEDGKDAISNVLPVNNVDAYTIIGPQQLNKLHDVCALSMFYVPGVAKFIESMSR